MGAGAVAAGGLAEEGDVVRVAAEGSGVALHPAQGRLLVEEAVVPGLAAPFQARVGEVAQGGEPG
ncbi:hypothetical protein Slala02_72990 [Streptomyces lavendulae subsp. lavendulae]|nr:hypothetical protein Slala01_71150 [Streptomyces lavendulae subsp. lavendulae]GLX31480.1 hypothetical protein Slala02_72990 [Streptomyces lavendulae subsp. lavendulae]